VEGLEMTPSFWKSKSVFLTGHTGFKGGWLAHWLTQLGANVYGYSLEPSSESNFFTETKLTERLTDSTIGDVRDLKKLTAAMKRSNADIVFHMAAQPLVRESYNFPVDTFATNVMGTVNLLEAARQSDRIRAIVNITTDKCYENKEWLWSYRESDRLGGHDPYSASKACAELVASSYRKSFLAGNKSHLASVRAGNVIGGGDWAADRLIPDFLRAIDAGQTLKIRSPNSLRPWQHVLEPLSGYMMLAQKLYDQGAEYADAWNFGPRDEDARSVGWIVERLCGLSPGAVWETDKRENPHEAVLLKLDSSKAKAKLGWSQQWSLEIALAKTVEWHRAWLENEDMDSLTTMQISEYLTTNKNVDL
jgi:CDP-glucose 4,6-dehydratase